MKMIIIVYTLAQLQWAFQNAPPDTIIEVKAPIYVPANGLLFAGNIKGHDLTFNFNYMVGETPCLGCHH